MSTASDTVKKKGKGKRGGIGQFIKETRAEWDKTSFPSSEDVFNTTVIVIIAVIFFSIFLYLVDQSWVFLLDQLAKLVNWLAGV